MHPLGVLMWKHCVVRKRRFIHTTIELVFPLILVFVMFLLKGILLSMESQHDNSTLKFTDSFTINNAESPMRVVFSPLTDRTAELMDRVAKKLNLPKLTSIPGRRERGIYGVTNTSEIVYYAKHMGLQDSIVLFEKMDQSTWPIKLNYTIRTKYNYLTHLYEPLDAKREPHHSFADTYEPFVRLQWTIDTSYIELLTEKPVTQRLSLQEFPFDSRHEPNAGRLLIMTVLQEMFALNTILLFIFQMCRVLEERCSGIQELIKMGGVSNIFIMISHVLNCLPGAILYAGISTLLLKVTSEPLDVNTSAVVFVLGYFFYFMSIVAFAHLCSFVVSNMSSATVISTLIYAVSFLAYNHVLHAFNSKIYYMLISILIPHAAFHLLWQEILLFESMGVGLTLDKITTSLNAKGLSCLLCLLAMMLQISLYMFLSWYLMHVAPGPYGQSKPWDFLFPCRNKSKKVLPDEELEPIVQDPKYFEKIPKDADVGIKISNVTKYYGNNRILNNVNLDVMKGEITILLGHNGAGKTTLMSIITGMSSASSGTVSVGGMEWSRHAGAVREQLGYCPQHNLFFPDLTVIEHVVYFTVLKSGNFKTARQSAMNLIRELGLAEKAKSKAAVLSGGMKRRLQLACALSHDAKVLVLDEPTSGLDVETRRELWNLLLSLRGDRTVLLTTHFMEEADALGDRVAALHAGILKCHATPMHLKRAVGSGFIASLTTNERANEATVTSTVRRHVPEATVTVKHNVLTYSLPSTTTQAFPKLFEELEQRRSELGIETIGVSASTLEEVFLQLCSNTTAMDDDEVDGTTNLIEPTRSKITGLPLYLRQVKVLLLRHARFLWFKKFIFIIAQVIIPIVMLALCVLFANNDKLTDKPENNPRTPMNTALYKDMPYRKVLYDIDLPGVNLRTVEDIDPKVRFEHSQEIYNYVLRAGSTDPVEYNKYLVGVELNETDAKILYTTTVRHATPVALNMLSNILVSTASEGSTITTYNHPLETAFIPSDAAKVKEPKSMIQCIVWAIFVLFIIFSTYTSNVTLPIKERVSSTRLIHIMSGCPAAVHWLTTLLFHFLLALVFIIIPFTFIMFIFEKDNTTNNIDIAMTIVLIVIVSTLAVHAFMYVMSFVASSETTVPIILIAFVVIFVLITPVAQLAPLLMPSEKIDRVSMVLAKIFNIIIPYHTTTVGVSRALAKARLNAFCALNKDKCPNLFVPDPNFDSKACCESKSSSPNCYLCFDDNSPLTSVFILIAQTIFYMLIVLLAQYGVFNRLIDRLVNNRYTPPAKQYNDPVVRAEEQYVEKAIQLPTKQIPDAMLVNDVHKTYFSGCKKKVAVKGVSFSVKKGECFGLLGVNGAGKSSTFKMLTGDECPTRGGVYANGHHFKRANTEYLRTLCYCPQFFGLDDFQTGTQNLTLLLTMRGLNDQDVRAEAAEWIAVVGLERYANQTVTGYSGGCQRRLAAGAALCGTAGGGATVLLDEPTAGVDPRARRNVWRALRRGLARGGSIVITSHSMEEIEVLCARVAIMSAGSLCALGSPAALRSQHGAGHALTLKLKPTKHGQDEVDGVSEKDRLKAKMHEEFNCTLKDEHSSMLHYSVTDTMRYSEVFSRLEALRQQFPGLLQDYSVSEATLEEVFLSYARDAAEA